MKVKISLNSAKSGAIEIVSDPTQESKFQVSDFTLSVYEIPTLEVIFPINESQKELLDLEKGDKISLSFDINDDGNFFTKFSGEINTQEITLNEDRTRTLKVEALNPFMRLQHTLINQNFISDCKGLRQIITRIMEVGGIWGKVIVDDDVKDEIEIGFVHEYPALSLLKQIFFQRDLVFDFDEGDILKISNRLTSHKKAMANMKTITEDQMISMTIKK